MPLDRKPARGSSFRREALRDLKWLDAQSERTLRQAERSTKLRKHGDGKASSSEDGAEREGRLAFFSEAARFTPMLAAETEDATFLVATADKNVGQLLFVKQSRREAAVLEQALTILDAASPDRTGARGTFVDLGANIGTSTVVALRTHGFAKALALEPDLGNFQLLNLNLTLNDLAERAVTLPVAASDRDGTVQLLVDPLNSGGHRVLTASGRSDWEREFDDVGVPAVTLDALAERDRFDPSEVELLWMDIQGYEAHALRGASTLTARGVPVVLELHPYLLNETDGLTMLAEILSERYTHFVDLRATPEHRSLHSATTIGDFASALTEDASHTDILVARLNAADEEACRQAAAQSASPES